MMNEDDRRSISYNDYIEQLKKNEHSIREMKIKQNSVTLKKAYPSVGRNKPCPCGSGKKYKHCHLREVESKYAIVS